MREIFDAAAENAASLFKLVFSDFKGNGIQKISYRRIRLSDPKFTWQEETFRENKAFQKNLTEEAFLLRIEEITADPLFRQANFFTKEKEIAFRISKKGKLLKTEKNTAPKIAFPVGNNEEKNYLLPEGANAPFMRDLGLFTAEGKIVRSAYDKYRQINRFLEILDHALKDEKKEEITVVDFGCGKSYLTFLVYYYFSVLQKKKVRIIGYDLKRDVVEACGALAKKYGYAGLSFQVADVQKDKLFDGKIDVVLSLHACDTATDFALDFAVTHGAGYIFSVPCCQHEINQAIRKGGEMDLFLSNGLIKERFCALLTDAIRVKVLEAYGYKTDVLEFVDFAHSPKNLMIRARRKKAVKTPDLSEVSALEEKYAFRQTLVRLAEKRMENDRRS